MADAIKSGFPCSEIRNPKALNTSRWRHNNGKKLHTRRFQNGRGRSGRPHGAEQRQGPLISSIGHIDAQPLTVLARGAEQRPR